MQLLSAVGDFLNVLGKLIPRLVLIPCTHLGVRFDRKGRVCALLPGLHWYWPIVSDVVTHAAVRDTINLEPQVMMTADDQVIMASAVLVYKIRSIVQALGNTADLPLTVSDIGLCAVVEALSSWQYHKERTDYKAIEKRLTSIAKRRLSPFGVEVIRCALTDLAPCRVFRLVGDTQYPGA